MKSVGTASSERQRLHHHTAHAHTRRPIQWLPARCRRSVPHAQTLRASPLRGRTVVTRRMQDLGVVLGTHANISRLIAIARVIRLLRRYRAESQRPAAGRLGALCQQEERYPVEPETSPARHPAPAPAQDPATELRRACASLVTSTERLAHDVHALAGTILALAPLLEASLEPGMRPQETPVQPAESGQLAAQRNERLPDTPSPPPDTTQISSFAPIAVEAPPVRFIPRPVRLNRRSAQPASPGAGYRVLAW